MTEEKQAAAAEAAAETPEIKVEEQPAQRQEIVHACAPADLILDRQFALIEQALKNPEIDVAKLEAMQNMHYRALDRQAEEEFNRAFIRMKRDLKVVKKLGTASNGKFARLEDIQRVVDPVLEEHDFFYSFIVDPVDGGTMIGCQLTHESGHSRTSRDVYTPDTSGNKNQIQAKGSSLSYGKRQMLTAVIGITLVDEDDDGDGTKDPGIISQFRQGVLLSILADCSDETRAWFAREFDDVGKVKNDVYLKLEADLKLALKKYQEKQAKEGSYGTA